MNRRSLFKMLGAFLALPTIPARAGYLKVKYFKFIPGPVVYTIMSGKWKSPEIWSTGKVPVPGDSVEIRHPVTIESQPYDLHVKPGYEEGEV